jgi:hypothetical protein
MTFGEAVESASEPIRSAIRPGKQGINAEHRECIQCAQTRRFLGSLNVEAAYRNREGNANLWDYGLGFRECDGTHVAIWVEVHPASTGEVAVFLRKLAWLKGRLQSEANDLARMSKRSGSGKAFHWIATQSGVHITPNSPQSRQLAQAGIDSPRRKLTLS